MSSESAAPVDICLERGKTGLGFNIKGGEDMEVMKGESGIFVAKVKPDGAAAIDGKLKVGDKIVEVNGQSLLCVTHEFAVDTFVKAGGSVKMVIIPGEEGRAKKRLLPSKENNENGRSYIPIIVVACAAVAITTSILIFRRNYRH